MRENPIRRFAGSATVAAALAAALMAVVSAQTPAPAAPEAKAQTAPAAEALPSARTIIDRHIEAIGGRTAILGHSSTHAAGTMAMASSGVSGSIDVYAARPNKSLVKLTIGGIGEVLEGFDGTTGWSLSAITGPMLATGKELAQKSFDAAYDADLHDPARYKSMRTVERTTCEGRPCYKISLVMLDGTEDLEFYDVQSRYKVAAVASRESPMGPVQVTLAFGDYRKFADLMVPTTMKQSSMGVQQVLTFTTVEFDKVPPSVFELPAEIKAMVK